MFFYTWILGHHKLISLCIRIGAIKMYYYCYDYDDDKRVSKLSVKTQPIQVKPQNNVNRQKC